ncbi:hypothetical protein V5799_004069 [Amblyomma americanum]|uniref:Lipocalin-5 1 n=1 Tax=Amblyomma americanum TaxID=6943 RepID=A0AAQ4D760_AMBAM
MAELRAVALILISLAGVTISKLGPPGGPLKLLREPVDSFKWSIICNTEDVEITGICCALQIWYTFDSAVAISDSDNDTIFECLTAKKTDINLESKTANFTFLMPTAGKEISIHVKPGDEPSTLILTSDDDPTPREGVNYYTDYHDCVVANLELEKDKNQCILWARREVKDNVPQDCIDHFVDICGVIVPAHSRDLCPDGEGDY